MAGYGTAMRNVERTKATVNTCGVCGDECPKNTVLCKECIDELQGQTAETIRKFQRGEL